MASIEERNPDKEAETASSTDLDTIDCSTDTPAASEGLVTDVGTVTGVLSEADVVMVADAVEIPNSCVGVVAVTVAEAGLASDPVDNVRWLWIF